MESRGLLWELLKRLLRWQKGIMERLLLQWWLQQGFHVGILSISILVPQNGEAGVKPEKGYRSMSTPHLVYPGQVDSFSYLNIGFFDNETEAENFRKYMMCKLPRFMMRTTYSSAHISQSNFIFVPKMDYTRSWTDLELYQYFGLSHEECELIESTMRPMSDS